MINQKAFLKIIDLTPLVSIDLIVEDSEKNILLGKRVNRPAQGYWFVPGGRIRKNERIDEAIKRISSAELGITLSLNNVHLYGAFDHIYHDNYFATDGINTHYVVLAYKTALQDHSSVTPDSQHSEIKWWSTQDLLNSPEVHQNTKNYFASR